MILNAFRARSINRSAATTTTAMAICELNLKKAHNAVIIKKNIAYVTIDI